MRLLVHPEPHESECLPDYAGRLADANGLSSSHHIYVALRARETAEKLIATPFAELSAMDFRRSVANIAWKDQTFHPSDILVRGGGVCGACMAHTGRRNVCWRSFWVVACTKHRVLLSDRCPSCNESHLVSRGTAVYCHCGFDLRLAKSPSLVPDRLISFQALIGAAFTDLRLLEPEAAKQHAAAPLILAQGGYSFVRFAAAWAEVSTVRRHGRRTVAMADRYEVVRALEENLRDGAAGLVAASQLKLVDLYQHAALAQKREKETIKLKRLREYCSRTAKGSTLYNLGEQLAKEWREIERTVSLAPTRALLATHGAEEFLSVCEASKMCGMAEHELRALAARKLVPSTLGNLHGRGNVLLFRSEVVSQLGTFQMGLLRCEEVATLLGISSYQVMLLVRNGVIKCAWGFRYKSAVRIPLSLVSRILLRFEARCESSPESIELSTIAVPSLPNGQSLSAPGFATAVLAVLRGELQVYPMAQSDTGLGRWAVAVGHRCASKGVA